MQFFFSHTPKITSTVPYPKAYISQNGHKNVFKTLVEIKKKFKNIYKIIYNFLGLFWWCAVIETKQKPSQKQPDPQR